MHQRHLAAVRTGKIGIVKRLAAHCASWRDKLGQLRLELAACGTQNIKIRGLGMYLQGPEDQSFVLVRGVSAQQ